MAQAVKTFAGTGAVMKKRDLILNSLKGFFEAFSEPMTVISVISCRNIVAGVKKLKSRPLSFQL